MARTTKAKKNQMPQVDVGAEIFASLRDLEKLKGLVRLDTKLEFGVIVMQKKA